MFDMKPSAPEGIRGPHKPISSNVDGIQVSEHLPRVAKIMDKVTLIRSMHHTMKNTTRPPTTPSPATSRRSTTSASKDTLNLFPAYGSVVSRLAPSEGEMPTFVSYPFVIRDGSVTPAQHASFLGKAHDPFLFIKIRTHRILDCLSFSLPVDLPVERLEHRPRIAENDRPAIAPARLLGHGAGSGRLLSARTGDAEFDAHAGRLQTSALSRSGCVTPTAIPPMANRACWPAVLVEAGTKFVTVYFSDSIGGQSTTSGAGIRTALTTPACIPSWRNFTCQ